MRSLRNNIFNNIPLKKIALFISVIAAILSCGLQIGIHEQKIRALEKSYYELRNREKVLYRIEYNLRRLIEKEGLIYEPFGE